MIVEHKKRVVLLSSLVALFLVAGILSSSTGQQYLATRLVQPPVSYSRVIKLKVPEDTYPQDYNFNINVADEDGNMIAMSEQVTVTVENVSEIPEDEPDDTDSDDQDNDSSGGGGSSSSGGGGGDPSTLKPLRRSLFYPQRGHAINGFFSGIVYENSRYVAKLGSNTAFLLNDKVGMRQPDDYWLFINAKHDAPAPVHLAVYLNDRAWKTFLLEKGDNQYRTHRVGLLRDFRNGRIKFRLVNDVYDKSDPDNENADRNLYIQWWALSNQSNPQSLSVGGVADSASNAPPTQYRAGGWALMPDLNRYISQELGPQHVNFDIWKYYAWRLSAPSTNRASISSESHLRAVMRYWKSNQPTKPRGSYL